MTSLALSFDGFVQVRLATDPDPADEPRGVSGWTHAAAGEPDLDRVLVLHEHDARRVKRSHGPEVGVFVRSVAIDGAAQGPGHPLVGATFSLLDAPKFEGRNWAVASDGREPIDPLHVAVRTGRLDLSKRDVLRDAAGTAAPFFRITPLAMAKRLPTAEAGPAVAAELYELLGVPNGDPEAWRRSRSAALSADLSAMTDPDSAAATSLRLRLADLAADSPAPQVVGFRMRYSLPLSGPGLVRDPDAVLSGAVDADADWPIDFWVGGWDSDAMCMFLRGTLTVPMVG